MSLTRKVMGLIKLPKLTPEGVLAWLCVALAGAAALEELARWLSRP
jgi:hypothetical protein